MLAEYAYREYCDSSHNCWCEWQDDAPPLANTPCTVSSSVVAPLPASPGVAHRASRLTLLLLLPACGSTVVWCFHSPGAVARPIACPCAPGVETRSQFRDGAVCLCAGRASWVAVFRWCSLRRPGC